MSKKVSDIFEYGLDSFNVLTTKWLDKRKAWLVCYLRYIRLVVESFWKVFVVCANATLPYLGPRLNNSDPQNPH